MPYHSHGSTTSASSESSEEPHPLDAVISQRQQQEQLEQQQNTKKRRRDPSPEPYINISNSPSSGRKTKSSELESGELQQTSSGSSGSEETNSSTTSSEDFDDALANAADSTTSEESDESEEDREGRVSLLEVIEDHGDGPSIDKKQNEEEQPASVLNISKETGKKAGSSVTVTTTKLKTPLGVKVIEEGKEQNAEDKGLERFLKAPRYFDDDFTEASGPRCFKCGGKGHMARDCRAPPREKPCFLCAGYGHDSRDCPNSLCWRCNKPGHMARDCPLRRNDTIGWDNSSNYCLRCGREDCPCAGERDYIRAEGGCTNEYLPQDLKCVRCYACGKLGHLSCAKISSSTPKPTCFNCGEGGHTGEQCWKEKPQAVEVERRGARQIQRHKLNPNRQQAPKYAGTKRRFDDEWEDYEDYDDDEYYRRRDSPIDDGKNNPYHHRIGREDAGGVAGFVDRMVDDEYKYGKRRESYGEYAADNHYRTSSKNAKDGRSSGRGEDRNRERSRSYENRYDPYEEEAYYPRRSEYDRKGGGGYHDSKRQRR